MITLSGIPIDPDECIGDSLLVINDSFIELDSRSKYLLSAVSFSAVNTDTISLERSSSLNALSASVKNLSITNKKLAFDGGSFFFRNKLINGTFSINQRTYGGMFAVPLNTVTTSKGYPIDRWSCECAPQPASGYAELFAYQSSDSPSGFTNSLAVSVVVPQTFVSPLVFDQTRATISQTVEIKDIVDLKYGTTEAAPLTLSFWAKSNYTGNYTGQIKTYIENGTNRSFVFSYTLSSTTWERKIIAIPADTDPLAKITNTFYLTGSNNAGMSVEFNIGSGNDYGVGLPNPPSTWINGDVLTLDSTAANPANIVQLILLAGSEFKITGVQLEKGTVETPFEYRPLTTEISLCQRYFETSYPLNTKPGTILPLPFNKEDGCEFHDFSRFVYTSRFQTEKRAVPLTAVCIDPATGLSNQANVREIGTTNCSSFACSNLIYPKTTKTTIAFEVNPVGIVYSSYYGLLHWVADSELY